MLGDPPSLPGTIKSLGKVEFSRWKFGRSTNSSIVSDVGRHR